MSNKKLLVDLSKSLMPSTYSNNQAKCTNNHSTYNGSYFHSQYLNGSKILSHFSSPRSSRSSCSTYSSTNSCSASCTSSSSSTSNITSTITTRSTNSTCSHTNGSPTQSSTKSTSSSSRISLNLSSSSHTCDLSDCNSNCSKAYSNGSSSSILSTSISNNSNSETSSNSSTYYSTDDCQPEETIYDDDDNNKISNKINNSYICNSSHSSGDNSISTIKTTSTTNAKITRSTSRLSKQNDDITLNEHKPTTNNYSSIELNNKVNCMWSKCKFIGNSTDIDDSLLEHIKSKHIFSQKNLKSFRCMWKECAVFKKPSCSFNWLERHVIDHIDTRPFLCIFTGCKRKFRTEAARERHVQSHINVSDSQPVSPMKTRQNNNNLLLKSAKLAQNSKLDDKTAALITTAAAKLTDSSKTDSKANLVLPNYTQILKALSKKRKALTSESNSKKFKTVKYNDYIDECTTSVVDSKLKTLNYESGHIVFKANVIGYKPKNASNKNEMFLIEWTPSDLLENEWIEKSQFKMSKTVSIKDLKLDSNEQNVTNKFNHLYRCHRLRPNKRK